MKSFNSLFESGLTAVHHMGGFYSIKPGIQWKVSLDIFAQNKLYYIKSGGCTITIKGVKYEGIPGRCFLIPSGVPHSYINDDSRPFSKFWMHFDLYPGNVKIFETISIPYYVDVPENSVIDTLFNEFETIKDSDKVYDIFNAKAVLMRIVAEYLKLASPDEKISMSEDNIVNKVVDYINLNIEKNIRVEELANLCHLHPTHFIRAFKGKTGVTPARFVQLYKLETAKRLIEETDIPLSEIMNRVGIVDAAQFSKKFRKLYGNSPRAFSQDICGRRKPIK